MAQDKVADTAAELLRSKMPFRDAVNAALDRHSYFEEAARSSAYRRVCAELQRRARIKKARLQREKDWYN